jgi:hypothetical protein
MDQLAEAGYPAYLLPMTEKCFKRCVKVSERRRLTEGEGECMQECTMSYMGTVDTIIAKFKRS